MREGKGKEEGEGEGEEGCCMDVYVGCTTQDQSTRGYREWPTWPTLPTEQVILHGLSLLRVVGHKVSPHQFLENPEEQHYVGVIDDGHVPLAQVGDGYNMSVTSARDTCVQVGDGHNMSTLVQGIHVCRWGMVTTCQHTSARDTCVQVGDGHNMSPH